MYRPGDVGKSSSGAILNKVYWTCVGSSFEVD